MPRLLLSFLAALATLAALALPAHAGDTAGIEDYAPYQPQTRCAPKAKPGTKVLGRWIVDHEGGAFGGISRPCRSGGTSEHKEGRAFDWTLDATRKKDRQRAAGLLRAVRATDKAGNADAKARRMGVMYIIWNDHMYSAWDEFAAEPYLSSSCKTKKKCSKTLRHRDHMHISLSRRGGKGLTSWYEGRLD
ncbi:hypothetical protein GCM10009623_25390 [Nocardioides aestuarii]|uniref:ARB-07466-like C-terminal domain-containing protein n=1 Tax=Nocardioides aestuarii TaxID=252231 RepID=A0ABW4TPY0_9ACTN